jgi:hypothetical protein
LEKLLGIISADFDIIGRLLIGYSAFKYWKRNGIVHQLVIDFVKACDSVRREVLYSILTEFGAPVKIVGLINCV